jgi:hypothetical protein
VGAPAREEWPRALQPIKPGERTSIGPAGSWRPSACAIGSPILLGHMASGSCWSGDAAVRQGAESQHLEGVTAQPRTLAWPVGAAIRFLRLVASARTVVITASQLSV